jgi:tRNA-Thr(GGU) m(6)t(6)A37 methyltransferase TsaA
MERPHKLTLEPIGVLHCAQQSKVEAPRQPAVAEELTGVIELYPARNFEHALEDIDGWERIWVIFWFHRNAGWRPKVLPPRSDSGRKGVFSTRSPHRPNPLGLSALKLERVEPLKLHVRGVDLLDGTPVLDIKPYVAYTDAFPDARSGWLASAADPRAGYEVIFTAEAEAQLAWIAARSPLPLRERITSTLRLGPQPHPYRRIKQERDGMRLAIQDWRIRFEVKERTVRVLKVNTGYRATQLAVDATHAGAAIRLHREFLRTWPDLPGAAPTP